jgi:hypothetical protein
MKAILEFNLPEDQADFELATYNAYIEARDKLREIMNENGVNLDDVS